MCHNVMNEEQEIGTIRVRGCFPVRAEGINWKALPGWWDSGIRLAGPLPGAGGLRTALEEGEGGARVAAKPAEVQLFFAELLGGLGGDDHPDIPGASLRSGPGLPPVASPHAVVRATGSGLGVVS